MENMARRRRRRGASKFLGGHPLGFLDPLALCCGPSGIGFIWYQQSKKFVPGTLVGVNNTDSKEEQRPKLFETGAVGRVHTVKREERSKHTIA